MFNRPLFILTLLLPLCCPLVAERGTQHLAAYRYLDDLALAAGTDKSSIHHNYTKIYAHYFDPIRNEKLKFLEIGILHGDSVKLWESYLVNAERHFVDIDPSKASYQSVISHYHAADQSDFAQMDRLATSLGSNFDIVIDDGGHTMRQQIASFKALFPHMASGGLYIIEDLCTSYLPVYGGHGQIGQARPNSGTCLEFLKGLVDDLNYAPGLTICADFDKVPTAMKEHFNIYQAHIDSIHFYPNLCVIIKR